MPIRRPWAFERGTLWEMDLDEPSPAAAASAGARFREALPGDIALLATAMGLSEPRVVRERFAAGRRCFIADAEGTIATYGWVSEEAEHIGELERTIRLPPGDAYVWDCATLPPFRGHGLYTALLCHIVAALRRKGTRRLWIGASLDNIPSIRGFRSAGFRPVIRLTYLRLLSVSHIRLVSEARAPARLVADARRMLTGGSEPRHTAEAEHNAGLRAAREHGAKEL
jgi:ribosomal protein S18 acetylase RimI-like enzyme